MNRFMTSEVLALLISNVVSAQLRMPAIISDNMILQQNDLNAITADKYEALRLEKAKTFFTGHHTHTNQEGARVNAAPVVDGIKQIPKTL